MNTNQSKDNNGRNVKEVDQKPSFTTSNALVFTNLHYAAVEKAAKVIGINAGDKNINQFIINSGMSDDGRTVSNRNDKINDKLRFGSKTFEVGIVLQTNATALKLTDNNKDQQEKKAKENEKEILNAKKLIFEGLKEYMKWFCGMGENLKEDDLVEFIPEYNGGKVQIRKGEILGMDKPEEMKVGFDNRLHKITKDFDPEDKLRIGYKIGYTINYGD